MGFKTYQEAYDKTVEHLNKQGCRAMSEDSSTCMYKAESGLACAVGCHLQDGKWMEFDGPVEDLLKAYPALENDLFIDGETPSDCISFWSYMQELHDNSRNRTAINSCLSELASDYELVAKEVTAWEPQ